MKYRVPDQLCMSVGSSEERKAICIGGLLREQTKGGYSSTDRGRDSRGASSLVIGIVGLGLRLIMMIL